MRAGLVEGPRPGLRHPPRRGHPGHDPPAARRVRPSHPRRQRPRHRPAAPRLAQPVLPPRPPPAPRTPARAPAPGPVGRTGHPRPHPRRDGPRQQQRLLLPLELTMTTPDDPIAALLDELAALREHLTRLDTRETGHHAALTAQ